MKDRSVLLQLARDSIQEVFEAHKTINRLELLQKYPLLKENIKTTLNIYIDSKLRGSSSLYTQKSKLLDDIILNAKKSAFEDINFNPLTTSEYLKCEIELLLDTPDGILCEKDSAILNKETTLSQILS